MRMIIELQHLPAEGVDLALRRRAADFPVLKSISEEGECRFFDPIEIALTVVPERNLIRVDGAIATKVEQACSRCLAIFASDLQRLFSLRFARQSGVENEKADEAEIELKAEHIGLTFFSGESIDLTESVQEQVVMALPYKPLCSADCKGLCARCGTDLNTESCNCAEDRSDNPFAVLGNMALPAQSKER